MIYIDGFKSTFIQNNESPNQKNVVIVNKRYKPHFPNNFNNQNQRVVFFQKTLKFINAINI